MAANESGKSLWPRGLWMFGLPLGLALIFGYVFIRSQNRALEMKLLSQEEKSAVLEGEVYRWKSLFKQKEAEINYLTSPDYRRYLIRMDSAHCAWLYYRSEDDAWFIFTDLMAKNEFTDTYTLFIDEQKVGTFKRVADSIGLQKAGHSPIGQKAYVIEGEAEEILPGMVIGQVPL